MTAVEWLLNRYVETNKIVSSDVLEAKEMEKQQIIDAFGVGCHLESKRLIGYHDVAEQYYTSTYGSNGSELKQIDQTNPVTRGSTALVNVTSSQTISDEEIEKEASRIHGVGSMFWEEGAKWYRDQLKSKICQK